MSKYEITLCLFEFLKLNNYRVLVHKMNFHFRISIPESILPLLVFDFGMSGASILYQPHIQLGALVSRSEFELINPTVLSPNMTTQLRGHP